MNSLLRSGVAGVVLLGLMVSSSHASVLYSEDFSAVDDWTLVFNQEGGAASITSSGGIGSIDVEAPSNVVAFGPVTTPTVFVPFTSAQAGSFSLAYTVDSVSGSTSYSIEIDQFDASKVYVSTVFGVIPQTAATGSFTSQGFDAFGWSGSTAFILPKIQMYTGSGTQTVGFDSLEIIAVPEPSTICFFLLGIAGAMLVRRRTIV